MLSIEHQSRVLVKWQLEPTRQNLLNLRFFIYRGESPEEMEKLNEAGIRATSQYEYVDVTPNLIDLHKKYYYKVAATEFSGNTPVQTFYSHAFTWDGDLDLVGLYVVEEHLFLYRHTSAGVPTMIYQRRHDGEQCPNCWDPVLKRVTTSNCSVCYGTGKLEGYYPPIDAWMKIDPDPSLSQVTNWGERQARQTEAEFTNYPELRPGDIILEVKPRQFWKVSNVRYPQKSRVTMLQTARIDAVNPSDIEHRLEVPQDRVEALLKALEERRDEREF